MTKVIVLCGGSQRRWENYLGTEKHFVQFNGKELIENTLQILKSFDVDVTIITREDNKLLYEKFNYNIFSVSVEQSNLEYFKVKSNFELWNKNGRTILLWGDVLFTVAAMKRIINKKGNDIIFFGRQTKSFFTKCDHGEFFGISFLPIHHATMKNATNRLQYFTDEMKIKIAGGWGMYDIISGLEYLFDTGTVIRGKALYSNFIQIIDYTDDIDYPKDYENYVRLFANRTLISDFINTLISKFYYFFKSFGNIIYEIKTIKLRNSCLNKSNIK